MPKTPSSYSIGLWHELHAIKLLESNGYKLIQHNYLGKVAQVDLVMRSKRYLAFIEVKKTSPNFKQSTLKRFLHQQKNRILGELFLFHNSEIRFKNHKPVLILLIFAKNPQPDLYLYYLTP